MLPDPGFIIGKHDPSERYAEPGEAAALNATGSPTGRAASVAAPASLTAAKATRAGTHRGIIYDHLVTAGSHGMTSIEAAAVLPLTAQGGPQVSNRAASRLSELWEEGRITVLRRHGTCALGVCHPHAKPAAPHRPMAPCTVHGAPVTRDGAAIWVVVGATPATDTQPRTIPTAGSKQRVLYELMLAAGDAGVTTSEVAEELGWPHRTAVTRVAWLLGEGLATMGDGTRPSVFTDAPQQIWCAVPGTDPASQAGVEAADDAVIPGL